MRVFPPAGLIVKAFIWAMSCAIALVACDRVAAYDRYAVGTVGITVTGRRKTTQDTVALLDVMNWLRISF